MNVELGNTVALRVTEARDAPTVTYITVPDTYTYEVAEPGALMRIGPDTDVEVQSAADLAVQVREHISSALMFRDGITHLPGQEALLAVQACQLSEGGGVPLWVWSDNENFAKLVSEFYGGIPVGRPGDLEDTHYSDAGPPGVGPPAAPESEVTP